MTSSSDGPPPLEPPAGGGNGNNALLSKEDKFPGDGNNNGDGCRNESPGKVRVDADKQGNNFNGFQGPFENAGEKIRMLCDEPYDPNYPTPAQYTEIKQRRSRRLSQLSISDEEEQENVRHRSRSSESEEKQPKKKGRRKSIDSKASQNTPVQGMQNDPSEISNLLDSSAPIDIDLAATQTGAEETPRSITESSRASSSSVASPNLESNFIQEASQDSESSNNNEVATVCIKSTDNSRIFNNPMLLQKMIEGWNFKHYVIPGSRAVPGAGNSFIIKMNLCDAINKVLFNKTFKLNGHTVSAKKLDNPEDNINYFRVGPISTDSSIDELKSDAITDNESRILDMSWIGKITPRSKYNGNFIKVKINGEIPKYLCMAHCRYPVFNYSVPILRCSNCLELGHSDITCKRILPRCSFCSKDHKSHSTNENSSELVPCPKTHYCFQCDGNHRPTSNVCPRNVEATNLHNNMLNAKESRKDINKKLRELSYKKTNTVRTKTIPTNQPISDNNNQSSGNRYDLLTEENIDDFPVPTSHDSSSYSSIFHVSSQQANNSVAPHFWDTSHLQAGSADMNQPTRTTKSQRKAKSLANQQAAAESSQVGAEQENAVHRREQFHQRSGNHVVRQNPNHPSYPPTPYSITPPPHHNPCPPHQTLIPPAVNPPPQNQRDPRLQRPTQAATSPPPSLEHLLLEGIKLFLQGYSLIQILKKILPELQTLIGNH